MKTSLPIGAGVVFLLFTSSVLCGQVVPEGSTVFRSTRLESDTYTSTAGDNVIQATPAWSPGDNVALPLSIDAAVKLARTALTEYVTNSDSWLMDSATLRAFRTNRWFYEVRFFPPQDLSHTREPDVVEESFSHRIERRVADQEQVTLVVLMSGRVLDLVKDVYTGVQQSQHPGQVSIRGHGARRRWISAGFGTGVDSGSTNNPAIDSSGAEDAAEFETRGETEEKLSSEQLTSPPGRDEGHSDSR